MRTSLWRLRRSHSRIGLATRLALASAGVGAAVPLLASPAAYGAGAGGPGANRNVVTFGTQTASATKPDGRGIYRFGATAGGRVEDHVAVINYSNQTATFFLRGTDAVNTPQGGFAALPVNDRSTGLGTWIALPSSDLSVTLPPRTSDIVPFLVEVPKNATPGDHVGVITATLESSIISKSGQRVHLLQTIGTRIFLRVSGPLHPGFTVQNLAVRYEGTANPIGSGDAEVTYTVRNTGNVALGGRQTVYVSGLFGSKKTAVHVAQVQLLLPGFAVHQTVRIKGIFPEVRDSGHVSITPLVIAGTVQPASGPYRASVSFWAIPWTLIAIIVGLILLVMIWWFVRRRRRRTPTQPGTGTPPAPASAGADDGQQAPAATGESTSPSSPKEQPSEGEPARVSSGECSGGPRGQVME